MKNRNMRKISHLNEDTKEIRNLLIITLIVILIAVGLYFLTNRIVERKNKGNSLPEAEINYDVCMIGTMFNRPYTEYYVFIYDSTIDEASQYAALLSNYKDKEDAKKIYYIDLSQAFNKSAVGSKTNEKPTSSSEVTVKDSALFLIKDGKVSKYYSEIGNYETVLN